MIKFGKFYLIPQTILIDLNQIVVDTYTIMQMEL